nr:folate-binding protein [Pseudohoeflea sp. DP4N28-3]
MPDRTLIEIAGDEASDFLERLVTSNVVAMPADVAWPSALLTPQGKILFDFLITRHEDRFLVDISGALATDFMRRMMMYRLRAAVEITERPERPIEARWGDAVKPGDFPDARFRATGAELPVARHYGTSAQAEDAAGEHADISAWNRLRIHNAVAESGADFALSDAFPHDVLMDLNGGIDFRKGCFVGQEVVSRMKHRNTARRRLAIVSGAADLPGTGTPIMAAGKPIGALGTVAGDAALAIIRVDRAGSALAAGAPITVDNTEITLALPAWTALTFPAPSAADESDQTGGGER